MIGKVLTVALAILHRVVSAEVHKCHIPAQSYMYKLIVIDKIYHGPIIGREAHQ